MDIPYTDLHPSYVQEEFLNPEVFDCGWFAGAGAGKSYGLLLAAAQFADLPHYQAAIFAPTYTDLRLPGGLLDAVTEHFSGTLDRKRHVFTFPSGAMIHFGYARGGGGEWYLRYKSSCFHFVGFDMPEQLNEQAYRYMITHLRGVNHGEGWRDRTPIPFRIRAAGTKAAPWMGEYFNARGILRGSVFDNPYVDPVAVVDAVNALVERDRHEILHGKV